MTQNKKSKRRPQRIPNKMREFTDIDYFDKLNAEEKNWLKDFVDAEYCNNHRKYSMYTEHPEYDRIKKEIYNRVNAVNTRCDYAKAKVDNKLYSFDKYLSPDMNNILEKIMKESIDHKLTDDIATKMGIKSFEDNLMRLLEVTARDIKSDYKDCNRILIRFYIKLKKLFSEERKQARLDRKLKK